MIIILSIFFQNIPRISGGGSVYEFNLGGVCLPSPKLTRRYFKFGDSGSL